MVVARQRPETANGIVFMLLEDERGTINLIVPPRVYERHRATVRAAPLVRARGRLEHREGTINVLVSELRALERVADGPPAEQRLAPTSSRPPRAGHSRAARRRPRRPQLRPPRPLNL